MSGQTTEPFSSRLVDALQLIRDAFLAQAIHALFETGVYDTLVREPMGEAQAAESLRMRNDRLTAFLDYACNEGLLERRGSVIQPAARLVALAEFRPWFQLLIGGYGSTLLDMQELLAFECTTYGARHLTFVAKGSSGISQHDTIPVVRELMADLPSVRVVVDIGSADASYLVALCKAMPGVRGIALEPGAGGAELAREHIAREHCADRIDVQQCTIQAYMDRPQSARADCYIAAFVLQELLAQEGRDYVVALLKRLSIWPGEVVHIVAIEANYDRHAHLESAFERAYYNPYFLVHELTRQRLLTRSEWLAVFEDADLDLVVTAHPPADVDPTGIEEVYVLRTRAS